MPVWVHLLQSIVNQFLSSIPRGQNSPLFIGKRSRH